MTVKGSGGRKLTQFMAHHVFGNEHGDKFFAIVYCQCDANEIGHYRRPARPSLDDPPVTRFLCPKHFFHEVIVNEWTLFQRPGHFSLLLACFGMLFAPSNDQSVTALGFARAVAFGGHAPRCAGVSATGTATFTASHGMVYRIHGNTANMWATPEPSPSAGFA
jgi:hypothetical protein